MYNYNISQKERIYRSPNHHRLLEKLFELHTQFTKVLAKPHSNDSYYSNIRNETDIDYFMSGSLKITSKSKFAKRFKGWFGKYTPHCYVIKNNKFVGLKPKSTEKLFFVKPVGGHGGQGIKITKHLLSTKKKLEKKQTYVAQKGVTDLLLIDGKKFDLRVFILFVKRPKKNLEIYLLKDAIVRICSQNYDKSSLDKLVQITNYHMHTNAQTFEQDKIKYIKKFTDCIFYEQVYPKIKNMACLLAKHVRVNHILKSKKSKKGSYWLCGLDVVVDEHNKPWLIEINKNPHMTFDSEHVHICENATKGVIDLAIVPIFSGHNPKVDENLWQNI